MSKENAGEQVTANGQGETSGPPFAKVTLGRVELYYGLLCEIGMDKIFDPPDKDPSAGMQTVTAEEQSQPEEIKGLEGGMVGLMWQKIGNEGLLLRMARIVFDTTGLSEDELRDIEYDHYANAITFFVQKSRFAWRTLLTSATADDEAAVGDGL